MAMNFAAKVNSPQPQARSDNMADYIIKRPEFQNFMEAGKDVAKPLHGRDLILETSNMPTDELMQTIKAHTAAKLSQAYNDFDKTGSDLYKLEPSMHRAALVESVSEAYNKAKSDPNFNSVDDDNYRNQMFDITTMSDMDMYDAVQEHLEQNRFNSSTFNQTKETSVQSLYDCIDSEIKRYSGEAIRAELDDADIKISTGEAMMTGAAMMPYGDMISHNITKRDIDEYNRDIRCAKYDSDDYYEQLNGSNKSHESESYSEPVPIPEEERVNNIVEFNDCNKPFKIDLSKIDSIELRYETSDYVGGIDSDGHERKDNFERTERFTSYSYSPYTDKIIRVNGVCIDPEAGYVTTCDSASVSDSIKDDMKDADGYCKIYAVKDGKECDLLPYLEAGTKNKSFDKRVEASHMLTDADFDKSEQEIQHEAGD